MQSDFPVLQLAMFLNENLHALHGQGCPLEKSINKWIIKQLCR